MIQEHNRRQILRAIGHLTVAVVATAATFGFFYGAFALIEARLQISFEGQKPLFAAGMVGFFYLMGFFHFWHGQLCTVLSNDDLFLGNDFPMDRGRLETHLSSPIANAGYGLLMLFYSAPFRLLRAIGSLRRTIRFSETLEADLNRLLESVRSVGEWHDAKRYRAESSLLRHLITMEQVDFSPHKGRIKAA